MKTPITKFLVFGLLNIAMIAVIKGDTPSLCDGSEHHEGAVVENVTLIEVPTEAMVEEPDSQEKDAFQFPNVFDALRMIF